MDTQTRRPPGWSQLLSFIFLNMASLRQTGTIASKQKAYEPRGKRLRTDLMVQQQKPFSALRQTGIVSDQAFDETAFLRQTGNLLRDFFKPFTSAMRQTSCLLDQVTGYTPHPAGAAG